MMIAFSSCLLIVWVRHAGLGAAGSWVVLCLVFGWRCLWEFSLINTPWGQEFSGDLVSWTQHSHSRGSVPTFAWGTKIPQVICHGSKGDYNKHTKSKKKKKKADTKNETQTNGKSKIRQIERKTKEHIHTYTNETKIDQRKQSTRE